jgi:hypothetical protein
MQLWFDFGGCAGDSSGSRWADSGCSSDRFEAAMVVAVAADELAVDAAQTDLRLHWWWQWQQMSWQGCSSDGYQAALVVAVAADR